MVAMRRSRRPAEGGADRREWRTARFGLVLYVPDVARSAGGDV